jgi:flagellar FliJ protein
MTTELQPLMALLAQAERERDDTLAHSQRLDAAHRAAQAQADQLLDYRRDYEQRWGGHFSRQAKVELLHCYQGFIDRLSQAIEQQARAAGHAGEQAGVARAALREAELRVASVRRLIERRVGEMQLRNDRREQKQTDEFAARAAWQRLSSFGSLPAR